MTETKAELVKDSQSPIQLTLAHLEYLIGQIRKTAPQLDELTIQSQEIRELTRKKLLEAALSFKLGKRINVEHVDAFLKQPYSISVEPVRGDPNSYYLHVPRLVDYPLGFLVRQTEGWNIFRVRRNMDWFGELPEELKKQLNFKEPLELKLEGGILKGPRPAIEEAWKRYKPFLKTERKDGIQINPKRTFELLASLINDGILPFVPRPISESELVDRKLDFDLRPYQKDAWKKFLEYANIGVFFPASTGKTVIGLYALTHLNPNPPHLVVVPTRLLVDQWTERIQAHTDLKLGEEVQVMTYHSAIRNATKEYSLLAIDEVHHLPANEFAKLALIKRKFTLGLSATPFREDFREHYVFALTGYPVGLSWDHFRNLNLIKNPVANVWLVKNFSAKLSKLEDFLKDQVKTIIFTDHIELGKAVSSRFKVPFIYGGSRENRFKALEDNLVVVASRVADEGISLPEIERVIEVDWLWGSRRQELQRFTRLLHGFASKSEGAHHILMTVEEYQRDKKRLFSVMDKGFKVVIHREGVSERAFSRTQETPRVVPSRRATSPTVQPLVTPVASPSALSPLPGMQKLFATLREPQQRLIAHLASHDGEWHSTAKLYPFLGFQTYQGMINSTNLPELERRKLIERKLGQIRTNFRGLTEP